MSVAYECASDGSSIVDSIGDDTDILYLKIC